jgi:NADH:ubiquinone oxidoreductase subunit 5 (subunit L)/multisubunit Na+/H+ antiporter MnhA subunit
MQKDLTHRKQMNNVRGKVPIFTLRPHPVVSMALVFVLIIGLLLAMSFYSKEDGTGVYRQKGVFTLILTAVISICLTIVATAKMWFTHLWKKNSTHDRHKNHSANHPTIKEREFRNQR